MYLIHFKGKMDSLEVETSEGNKIKEMLVSGSPSTFIEIQNRMISLGSIKAVIPTPDLRSARLADPDLRPLTPQEREKSQEILRKMRVEMEEQGILSKKPI